MELLFKIYCGIGIMLSLAIWVGEFLPRAIRIKGSIIRSILDALFMGFLFWIFFIVFVVAINFCILIKWRWGEEKLQNLK